MSDDEGPIQIFARDGGLDDDDNDEAASEGLGPASARDLAPSRGPSRAPSNTPSNARAGGSRLGSEGPASRPMSGHASHATSVALSEDLNDASADVSLPRSKQPSVSGSTRPAAGAAGTPSRPPSRGSVVSSSGLASPNPVPNLGPGAGSGSRAGSGSGSVGIGSTGGGSLRRTPPGSQARPGSPSPYNSNDYTDILANRGEMSATSLPRGPPSVAGSAVGTARGSLGGGAGSIAGRSVNARTAPASAASAAASIRSSPRNSALHSPAAPASGAATPRGPSGGRPPPLDLDLDLGPAAAAGGRSGFSTAGHLPPPEVAETPAGFYAARSGGAAGAAAALRRSRREVQCDIPTPLELFRLYDTDQNGRVTEEEFLRMLRDLDALPHHFAPPDDPEHRLGGLRDKRKNLAADLAGREAKLSLAETYQRNTPEAARRDMAAEVEALRRQVAELDGLIAADEEEARGLTLHPDPDVRVTAELRQQRAQWRKWAQEEFNRADLAGNEILSIDEFYMYYYSKLCFRFPVLRTGVSPGALLFNIFVRYCSFGRGAVGGRNEDMLSHQFYKLCKDAGLLNGKEMTKAAVDIIYHRARAADESLETYKHKAGVAATARMYYPQFLFALDKVAAKRRSGFQEVVALVVKAVNVLPEPTFADFLILDETDLPRGGEVPEYMTQHRFLPSNSKKLEEQADNKMIAKMREEGMWALRLSMGIQPGTANGGADSTAAAAGGAPWAGRGAAGTEGGGNSTAYAAPQSNLYGGMPELTIDPQALRQKKWERPEPGELRQSRSAAASHRIPAVNDANTMHEVRQLDMDHLMASLKRVYEAYCAWGGGVDRGAMDGRRFSKVLRDARLVAATGPMSVRAVEAVHRKVLPVSCKALNFLQFIEALRHVALIHRMALNEVVERLVATGGPQPGP